MQDTILVDGYLFEIFQKDSHFDLSDFQIDMSLVRQNLERDLLLNRDLEVVALLIWTELIIIIKADTGRSPPLPVFSSRQSPAG